MADVVALFHTGIGRDAFVRVRTVEERSGPGREHPVLNRIHVGQKVTVWDRKDGWARINDSHWEPRWIIEGALSYERPDTAKGFVMPPELLRPDLANLPLAPSGDLLAEHIRGLRRFAAHVLDTRQAREIMGGDTSANDPTQFYVHCDNGRRIYSGVAQWVD